MSIKIEKATLTKTEIMRYLGIGETRFKKLLTNSNFPKEKPVLEKWSKIEIDRWLNNLSDINHQDKELDWRDFIGH